jgi:hypothetical protein
MGNGDTSSKVRDHALGVSKRTRIKKIFVYGISLCLVSLTILFVLLVWQIHSHVEMICVKACQKHPGDRVEALIAYIFSDEHSLQDRNHAIWALGHIGDERALPALEKLYTGMPCDHEKFVCQYELRKAIDKVKGKTFNFYLWK